MQPKSVLPLHLFPDYGNKIMMPIKILVTGGSGFIGSNLTKALLKKGFDVRVFYREADDPRLLKGLPVQHFKGDITDSTVLEKALAGCEIVFHTVANMSIWYRDRKQQYKVNVEGIKTVVSLARKAGVKRFIHTSTVNTIGYPEDGGVSDENVPFNWDKLDFYYAITKKEAEDIVLSANSKDFQVVVVNPGTVFGPGDINLNTTGNYIKEIDKGNGHFVTKGGTCCVHVDAVISGHIAAFEKGVPGEKYILGGENLTYKEIFGTIADVLGKKNYKIWEVPTWTALLIARLNEAVSVILGKKPKLTAEVVRGGSVYSHFSSEKARKHLDFPFIPLRKAVEDTILPPRGAGLDKTV
jgi:dihydroflavonol-4-reductase